MTLEEIKDKHAIKDQDIAKWFGYKNRMSYYNAKKGKTKIENGLISFYRHIAEAIKDQDVSDKTLPDRG